VRTIVVKDEATAFKLLQKAINDELGDQPFELKFSGWPVLSIKLKGEGYDSTITADVAEALVEVQRALNRAYARAVKGTTNSRTLTDTERREVQFQAKVKKGSSLIEINLGDYAEKLATAITTKMTPDMLAITVIGLAAVAGGTLAVKWYLNGKSQDKQIESDERAKVALSQEETKRLQVFADAMVRQPALRHATADFDEARTQIMRSAGTANTITVNDVEITSETARVISTASRTESEEVQLNGTYFIMTTDLRQPDEIRMRVRNAKSGREFSAGFKDRGLHQEQIRQLQDAEWTRSKVYLSINARELRGEITTATVISVGRQASPARQENS
jgi:hypothetical protein